MGQNMSLTHLKWESRCIEHQVYFIFHLPTSPHWLLSWALLILDLCRQYIDLEPTCVVSLWIFWHNHFPWLVIPEIQVYPILSPHKFVKLGRNKSNCLQVFNEIIIAKRGLKSTLWNNDHMWLMSGAWSLYH